MAIFADEDLGLTDEFEAACADPNGLDCGFTAQREATGFANFGFDPDEAAELRAEEEERIIEQAEEWDEIDDDDDWGYDGDDDYFDEDDDDDWDEDEYDFDDEDDDDYWDNDNDDWE